MIGTSYPAARDRPPAAPRQREEHSMDSLTSGTSAGAGSFLCRRCGYMLTLDGSDTLSDCPGCGGRDFARASLFSAEPPAMIGGEGEAGSALLEPASAEWDSHLAHAREAIEQPGEYL